ncbi:MAG TPA: esterase-like activity of phytase family protein, partial [Thermoanaerobaculia bacterium]|nr:esterase-like activity of phytase family protein [Thermoanaerobaculia bacterium]
MLKLFPCRRVFLAVALSPMLLVARASAEVKLLAVGSLTDSRAGSNVDVSGLTYSLENGVPANLLGGLGSGLTYASANTFLALPDRGPNAFPFDSAIDDTVSYINRFHTITMDLNSSSNDAGLPFTLIPHLKDTTLLWSRTDLVYGTGAGLGVGSGVPPVNDSVHHYFTGRSDNFDAAQNSGDSADARFDTESIRVSNDKKSVFISDEYGPYIYQFDERTGERLRSFALPTDFYVSTCKPVGSDEIANNTVGRTANKGIEGLAITPDGTTLVGIVQAALIQDASQKGDAAKLLRIVVIDIASGNVTHEYAYKLTDGTGVSEILALNNHEFLVDERDGRGREGGNNLASNDARVKKVFKIDLNGATDVTGMDGKVAVTHAVAKSLFLDIVHVLVVDNGFDATFEVPSKIEGLTFGPDVTRQGQTF